MKGQRGKGHKGHKGHKGKGKREANLTHYCEGHVMTIQTYRDLVVWQKSVAFVTRVYTITRHFPNDERFGLTSQLRRCAVSIPSNVAEGYGRHATKDYVRFLHVAEGSLCEVQTQLLIAKNLNFLSSDLFLELDELTREIERMLTSMIRKLEARD